MTKARQVANFDPALFAADEVSGDKVHGGTHMDNMKPGQKGGTGGSGIVIVRYQI